MINVFVCEDNKEQREKFTKAIEDIIMIENFDMEMTLSTENPKGVIDYLKNNDVSGLYFLDVDLKSDINGIKLAEIIREYDPRGFIVFVTTHAEMSYLTFIYKVEAMDYIIKDNYNNVRERIHQCIVNANKKYSSKATDLQKNFTLKADDKIINIEYNKILFFETSTTIHKVVLHAIDRQVEFYAKMKQVEDKLDERFYRCHRSFLVNKHLIKEIDMHNRIIKMINGEECLVSTRLVKNLIKN
ncbi:LytR/AlgR family response regulator transcription factor [Clostridium saccharobutylicum]|uniref:Stage 0 sporulation protein A homolog n=1 Tax=Clostridium saccharobutylicum DSM 13864 TaxID=1345695 RepID=U5MXU2_CLOSA|nr:LytTR family DNA-binding domain-containing protein [Clostridium saccharobutylicum]AGX45380.1 accessory gene regulator protein A [Clostridium saccharobutylicum DSM 13864]AQR92654.1 accessory gene regulator protein A [Clostridium saccharobutylicum]AQS02556.1 accessory protein regulator protein A [Clostridium saccharobutylicum]AQS12161.1 accessory gene regulator protein A [Clostridium saccharobutylicum]AQS16539.1 accessory gene regulator protein A [Clostridium saccharobutylicum]